jgi:CDP-diglyceride synthetase
MLLRSLWLALPVILGGAVHIAVLRAGVFPTLARLPLDLGLRLRGRRLFGANKTWRGALTMIGAIACFSVVQGWFALRVGWARRLVLAEFSLSHPVLWGLLLGCGYIAGELPNSLLKRQLGIGPGEAAASPGLRRLFWLVDQVDSLAGVLLFMCMVYVPPLSVVASLTLITLLVHPAMALVMVALGLKDRVG